MLLEFSCSNFKSIREKVLFSMIAGKDDSNEESLIDYGKNRVLRSAAIYGANGSGKSALVEAIQFVKDLVCSSVNLQPGQGVLQIPHKTLGFDSDSEYAIQFVKDGVRFAYGFTLNKTLVSEEYLYYFPKGRQTVVFERDAESYQAGSRFVGGYEACKDVFRPNRLFLSCAANFSAVPEVARAFEFFRDDLVVYRGLGLDNWLNYSLNVLSQDGKTKSEVVEFLQNLGTGVQDIKIKKSQRTIDPSALPAFLSDDFKRLLIEKSDFFDVQFVYKPFAVELQNESTGNRKLLEFVCPFLDILKNGKILVCDELEAHFHESIVYGLVDLFRKMKSSSQLIFTTHDTSILDLSLFRRDQIWFAELSQEKRSTDLYSLAEVRNVRKDENVGRGYIAGKYGAIPMLNSDLAILVQKERKRR